MYPTIKQNEDTNEKLKIQYYADSCIYYNDTEKEQYIKMFKHTTKRCININFKLFDDIYKYNPKHIVIFVNNGYINIKHVNDYYNCVVFSGNYLIIYKRSQDIKTVFVNTIKDHNYTININNLFEIIKHKLHILKLYFININDIYKYILHIMKKVYLDDDDIFLKLFFEQDVESIIYL